MLEPYRLTAIEAAAEIEAGRLSSEALVRSCIARIHDRDPVVKAWVYVNGDAAIAQARECDKSPQRGLLHGVPVGIKDMIDTFDMPTTYNSPIYVGYRPARDAACVALLRNAGAVILGKTDTVEFASIGRTALTRNPHDPERTPGGSSSGSAAAVADYMTPLALSTQTGGSTIRPASFCGVFAMKPTFGLVSPEGMKVYAPSLDTLGWMARSVSDLALLARVYGVIDDHALAPIELNELHIGYYQTPLWDQIEPAAREALKNTVSLLKKGGAKVDKIEGTPQFAKLTDAQNTVMHHEGRAAYLSEYRSSHALLHDNLRAEVENHLALTPDQIRRAYDLMGICRAQLDQIFEGYDAWLVPSAPGEAPLGLSSTGLSTFNRMWTALHVPCINVPGMIGPNGLPVGVQLVAPRFADARLLEVAAAVATVVRSNVTRILEQ